MWNISTLKVSVIVSHDDRVVMDIVFQPWIPASTSEELLCGHVYGVW